MPHTKTIEVKRNGSVTATTSTPCDCPEGADHTQVINAPSR